jgi:ABC-type branched-subunit amino acid transport system substrate-binding protein
MKKLFAILFTAVALLTVNVDASPVFDRAVSFYKAGQYDSTIVIVRAFLKTNGKDAETEVLVPLVCEALARKNDFSSVERLFTMFNQKYQKSAYLPRMWYLKGIADAKLKKYPDAVSSFQAAINGGLSSVMILQVINNVELLGANMGVDELSGLISESGSSEVQEIIRYFEIVKLVGVGQFGKAQTQADTFKAVFPRSRFESSVRDLIARAKEQERSSLLVGVLAPLTGETGEVGKRVADGARLAFELYNGQSGQMIKPVICDTKGSMMENARKTKELIEVHKVPVILGPVLSQDAIVSASMVIGKNTTMLTPTATEEGIAQLGDNIYQMNVSIGTLARKVASYAMNNLNMKEFAILAPSTEYGITMANSFKDELKKKNIEVIAEEYFEEGANDFGAQFGSLRNKLLQKYFERQAIDKGTFYKGAVSRNDSIKYKDTSLTVNGLFIPAESDDVVMLAPQVAFNRIKTQILGSNGWQSKKVLQDGSTYVQGALISATIEPDQNSKEWLDFKASFRSRFKYDADRICALGYDAANLIINAVRMTGSGSSSRIADALQKVQGYQGLSGVVSFDQANNGGANAEAAIMKITPNGFVRVQ